MFQTDGEIFTASEIEDCATADLTPPQGFDRLSLPFASASLLPPITVVLLRT
jgi:hypothetical protein